MMVMTANPQLSVKAGKARIHYQPFEEVSNADLPSRIKEDIELPLHPKAEFVPLKDGQQFLFTVPMLNSNAYDQKLETAAYFGGTDEEPFLVRLNPRALDRFTLGGKAGFFDALRPTVIKRLERVFGKQTERQGDIFAIHTPFTWKTLKTLKALELSERDAKSGQGLVETKQERVFGTRHLFTGVGLTISIPSLGETTLVSGLLEAPDHADLTLKGVYILAQAANLFDPKNAD